MTLNLGIVERVTEMLDRRKDARLFGNQEVILLVPGDATPQVARVADRSAGGLRITHKVHLDEGTEIRVLTPCGNTSARVVWTSEESGKLVSGLRLAKH